jgi:hypothetical protein
LRGKIPNRESAADDVLVALLLPISRLMLTSGVGVDQLIRAAKQAHIEAAIAEVFPSGARVNISRLAVATGLTRKEIASLVGKFKGNRTRFARRTKEQRAMRVLRGWRIDPRFHHQSGHAAELPMRGDRMAFSSLVKLYGGDVTPTAVLRELERMKAVVITRSGMLRMRPSSAPFQAQATQHMLELARLFGDFARTITQPQLERTSPTFFGFKDCAGISPDDAARFQRTFSRRAAAVLESFDQWLASRGKTLKPSAKTTRVGIGVYLVNTEAPQPFSSQKPLLKARRRRRVR